MLDTAALTLENAIETLICVQCGYTYPQAPQKATSAIRRFDPAAD